MEINEISNIIEALLFVWGKPLSLNKIFDVLNADNKTSDNENGAKDDSSENKENQANIILKEKIEKALNLLTEKFEKEDYNWKIINVANGYQFVTKETFSPWVKKLYKSKFTIKLSIPALETLSIIAYKQPLTRAEIDSIRGTDSSGVLGTLINRKLIKISGKKETIGRPALYSTTSEFLRYFGLNNLKDLPEPSKLTVELATDAQTEFNIEQEDNSKEEINSEQNELENEEIKNQ